MKRAWVLDFLLRGKPPTQNICFRLCVWKINFTALKHWDFGGVCNRFYSIITNSSRKFPFNKNKRIMNIHERIKDWNRYYTQKLIFLTYNINTYISIFDLCIEFSIFIQKLFPMSEIMRIIFFKFLLLLPRFIITITITID